MRWNAIIPLGSIKLRNEMSGNNAQWGKNIEKGRKISKNKKETKKVDAKLYCEFSECDMAIK